MGVNPDIEVASLATAYLAGDDSSLTAALKLANED